mmetsp:Transcript_90597/g.233819  ORF Transcript_90597/g.233819 Transcript_90597/m.233819 type:complete len:472 (-) Transcript_90597:484-1899(-)
MAFPAAHTGYAQPSQSLKDRARWSALRRKVAEVVENYYFESGIGILILFNMVTMAIEADSNAGCERPCAGPVYPFINKVLLTVYTAEIVASCYAFRIRFFRSGWNWLDMIIIAVGWVDVGVEIAAPDQHHTNFQFLRMLRLIRLVRASRLLSAFPELDKMIRGFFWAMKAMGWGLIMTFVLLIIWSMFSVTILHRVNMRLSPDKRKEDCEDAFASIFNSVLLLFQTLVAGDSWGACAVPVIKEAPMTFVIFAGALFSVTLGLTNLILAVIVDSAAAARDADMKVQIETKKQHEAELLGKWEGIIRMMDENGDGNITKHELLNAYEDQEEIRDTLTLLDIARPDLDMLFSLLDYDNNGSLSCNEFVSAIQRAQGQDMRMYMMLIRLQIGQLSRHMQAQCQGMARIQEHLGLSVTRPNELHRSMLKPTQPDSREMSVQTDDSQTSSLSSQDELPRLLGRRPSAGAADSTKDSL